jgi:hypothetical protein
MDIGFNGHTFPRISLLNQGFTACLKDISQASSRFISQFEWMCSQHFLFASSVPSELHNLTVNFYQLFVVAYVKSSCLSVTQLELNLIHTVQPCFRKVHFSILILSVPKSEWSRSFKFSNQNAICNSHLPVMCYIPCPSHPCGCDHSNT